MLNVKKYNFNRISSLVVKAPRAIAKNFFLAIFIFLIIVFLLGSIIFYKYVFLAQNSDVETSSDILRFNEEKYQKILVIWLEREKRFEGSDSKTYLNPFRTFVQELTK